MSAELRLRLALDAAEFGLWDWDVQTNEMFWDERARKIAGLALDIPLTVENIRNVTHPDDLPRTWAMASRALDPAIRAREPYEYRVVRPDGEIRWLLAHGEAVFDETERKPLRYIGTSRTFTHAGAPHVVDATAEARRLLRVFPDCVLTVPQLAQVIIRESTKHSGIGVMVGREG